MEHQRSALESDCFLQTSKITDLINNVTKMLKSPTIESDLSQVLDEFLNKLGECDKYLQNGIFNMNFAEAALLLQSSADLYSKKVDLLWDIIFDYQKRMLLSEEQNGNKEQELEKVEERKRKYKRKRKTNADESQTTTLVNSFSFGPAENVDYLTQHYDTVDLTKEWSKFELQKQNDISHKHVANKRVLFAPNDKIYTENDDYIGRYEQFHSTSLVEEIFHLEENKLLADDYNCVTNMRIDSYVVNDFLLEKSIPTTASKETYIVELNKYISNFIDLHKNPEKSLELSNNAVEQLYCRKSVVCLERLPSDLVKDKIRRGSLADSLFDDDNMSTVSENCPSPCNPIRDDPNDCGVGETYDQIGASLENRSKSCSQDSAFYEEEEQIQNENEAPGDVSADLVKDASTSIDEAADSTSVTSEADASNIEEAVVTYLESATEEFHKDSELAPNSETAALETSPKKSVKDTRPMVKTHMVTRKRTIILENFEDEEPEIKRRKVHKRKISEKALKKLATGFSALRRDFEIFCRLNYKAADGEGVIEAYVSDGEQSDEDEAHVSEEEVEEEEAEDNEEVPSPSHSDEETSDLEETQEEVTTESAIDETCEDQEISASEPRDTPNLPRVSPIPALNLPSCSTSEDKAPITSTPCSELSRRSLFASSDADAEQEDLCRKNVREWRSFILPKIRNMEHKADFDIHEYGSRIMEPSEIGEERHFNDIVKGKNSAEVARYFIATLQLANTYNVEISGAIPGEISNDSFKIKTLDKTKHHELLEEYQAPSEETFRERLERVKALNPKVPLHSTPNRSSAAKKTKFTVFSMKQI